MHWLEFLGILPKGDHAALRFKEAAYWEVDGTPFAGPFFRALSGWAPLRSFLYLEGTGQKRVAKFLSPRQVPNPTQVAVGTIMQRSDIYHVAARPDNLRGLADLIEEHKIIVPVTHIVLYQDSRVLLSWYDAFCGDPMFVSSSIAEATVRDFATQLEMGYRWRTHAA